MHVTYWVRNQENIQIDRSDRRASDSEQIGPLSLILPSLNYLEVVCAEMSVNHTDFSRSDSCQRRAFFVLFCSENTEKL